MLGVAVGEVQAGDVHPRVDHPLEDIAVPRRRPDRGDDLGGPHWGEVYNAWVTGKMKSPLLAAGLDLERLTLGQESS